MKILFPFIIIFLLTACNKADEHHMGGTFFKYLPRTCEYATAFNFYRTDVGAKTGFSELNGTYEIKTLKNNKIAIADYLLSVGVSFNDDIMKAMPDSYLDFNSNDYLTKADPNMERQLDRYLNQSNSNTSSSSPKPMANLVRIEYRQEEVKNIKIASTTTIFGVEAGNSLNNKIEIFDTPARYDFLFTYNKQLIGEIKRGWSIKKYLSYRPIASANLRFRFTSTLKAPLKTRFIVEMGMANGKILRDTTSVVNLLP